MLVLLSPAKKLNFEPASGHQLTTPLMLRETRILDETTRKLSPLDLQRLMKLSDALAQLNYERFQDFDPHKSRPAGSKQAALAFAGDTYTGLSASGFSIEDMAFAQDHVAILSGLYGVLRPLDAILPYRLEMGTRLTTPRGASLYDFWGERVALSIGRLLKRTGSDVVVNCASQEYFAVLPPGTLKARVVTPIFKEQKSGKAKVVSFCAKRARGAMARYVVKNRLSDVLLLKKFKEDGYRYMRAESTETEWVFVR